MTEASGKAHKDMVEQCQKAIASSRHEAAEDMLAMQHAIERKAEQEMDVRTKDVHRKLQEQVGDKAAFRRKLDEALAMLQARELGVPSGPVFAPGADPPLPPRDNHQPATQSPPRPQLASGATNPAMFHIGTDDEKMSFHSPMKSNQSEQPQDAEGR